MRDLRQLAKVVQRLLRKGAHARVIRVLEREHAADIAQMLTWLNPGEVGVLFAEILPLEVIGELLDEVPEKDIPSILGGLSVPRITELLHRLDPADAVFAIGCLDEPQREIVLSNLPSELRILLERIFSYPENTAGRAASPVLVTLNTHMTVQEAIAELRRHSTEDIWDLYIVDPGGQLIGILPVRRILVAPPETPVRELLVEVPVTVGCLASVEEAARACARYDLMAVPVVDDHHNLVGIITVDDVIDIIEEEATEALYGIAGLQSHLRVGSNVKEHLVSRMPWVFLNLFTASMAAFVVGTFEATIAQAAFLAAFMPVVAGMGGNMGTQTLTLVTRGLALGEVAKGSIPRILSRQIIVGVVLGIIVGSIIGLGGWIWKDMYLGLAILLAMIGNFVLGAIIGTVIPVLFEALDRDPAVGSGVLVTAVTDILGFLQFLLLAGLLLGLL
ncbi:MAG: magnesium transporter [Myxococcales bacterium]|nr:magnesium transporter [Myxococcales bacterium]